MNKDAYQVLSKLSDNSYFVGGAVRDNIIGIEYNDIDIATDLLPNNILKIFPDGNTIGKRFGTVIVNTPSGDIDITTMRKDITPGIHPDVAFTDDLTCDLMRRDFTINAIAMDIDGNIIDPFNGIDDINKRMIRAVGDPIQRIQVEDPRRAFRAARLCTQLNFSIDINLIAVIYHADISAVDGDFIRTEMLKGINIEPNKMLSNMFTLNLLQRVIPEFMKLLQCKHNPKYHPEGNAFWHTLHALSNTHGMTPIQKVAVMLHDIGKPETMVDTSYHGHAKIGVKIANNILKRLKFSNQNIEEISFCIENHMKMHDIENMRKSKRYALYKHEFFYSLLAVHIADSCNRKSSYNFIMSDIPSKIPERLVNGHDLMSLGFKPDKMLGYILNELYKIQLDCGYTDKGELIKLLQR